MSHQCTCPCHSSKVAISHVAPCCMRCNVCGDQIRMECLKDHARACNPVEVMERRVGERLAVIEDTLVEALAFYRSSEPKAPTVKLLPPQASDRRERDVGVAL